MKKITAILLFAALFALSSCQKDDCPKCTVYLINSEQYTYQMSVTGMQAFPLKPAETKEIEIDAGKTYTITGKPNTYYAHNNFSKSVKCDGSCAGMVIEVKN